MFSYGKSSYPIACLLILAILFQCKGSTARAGQLELDARSDELDDPKRDGWGTEVLQQAAGKQLERVADVLSGKAESDVLEDVIHKDFQCGYLRPALHEVFRDPSLVVLRAEQDSTDTNKNRYRGRNGLIEALSTLEVEAGDNWQVKFKVFRIEASANAFVTRQFFSASRRTPEEAQEINAIWRCHWRRSKGVALPRLITIKVTEYEEVAVRGQLFSDCTEPVVGHNACFSEQLTYGLDYWNNRLVRADTDGMQGIAVGDVNGDGLDDFYVCQIAPLPNRLFVQHPDGTATDMSAHAQVDWMEPTHSALFVDLDNDGDQDLLIGTVPLLLAMENDGHGVFSVRSKIPAARDAYSLAAADYDLDGDVDIFACVYLAKSRRRQILAVPVPFHDARNGGRNVLLRNDGAWRLRDVTRQVGLEAEATRRSFAASWEDYDNDGDPDLYVANDYGRNNLFRNDAGRFVDVANTAKVEDQSFGMSASWSDFNRDGWMDLYVSNMFSAAGNRIVFQRQFKPNADADDRRRFQYMARGNSLFQNDGGGAFRDISAAAGIMAGYWSWGSQFVELNNDGHEDLIVANGYLTRSSTHDL